MCEERSLQIWKSIFRKVNTFQFNQNPSGFEKERSWQCTKKLSIRRLTAQVIWRFLSKFVVVVCFKSILSDIRKKFSTSIDTLSWSRWCAGPSSCFGHTLRFLKPGIRGGASPESLRWTKDSTYRKREYLILFTSICFGMNTDMRKDGWTCPPRSVDPNDVSASLGRIA